jgi:hypothetical protein
MPMPQADWHLLAAYETKLTLDAPGFAFEFLSRNPEFIQHYRKLLRADARHKLTTRARNDFASRWGLRFREASTSRQKTDDPLDGDGPAKCHGNNHDTAAAPAN